MHSIEIVEFNLSQTFRSRMKKAADDISSAAREPET
jgi:hypothetical protein